MTKYIYFNEDLDTESVTDLVDKVYRTEGKMRIYISTHGGYSNQTAFLISALNSRKKDITLVMTDFVASCGTFFLLDFEGEMEFFEIDVLLFHCVDRSQLGIRKEIMDAKKLRKMDMDCNRVMAQRFYDKGWFDVKQKRKFLRGEDVVMYKDEIMVKYNNL